MVKLMNDARYCDPIQDIDIWHQMLESSAKDLCEWHRDRVKELDLVDTADYMESHGSSCKHAVHQVAAIEERYADCKGLPLGRRRIDGLRAT